MLLPLISEFIDAVAQTDPLVNQFTTDKTQDKPVICRRELLILRNCELGLEIRVFKTWVTVFL